MNWIEFFKSTDHEHPRPPKVENIKWPKPPKCSEELERDSLAELVSQLVKNGKSFSIDYKRVGDTCKADIKIGGDERDLGPMPDDKYAEYKEYLLHKSDNPVT